MSHEVYIVSQVLCFTGALLATVGATHQQPDCRPQRSFCARKLLLHDYFLDSHQDSPTLEFLHSIILEKLQRRNVPCEERYKNESGDGNELVDDDLCLDEGAIRLGRDGWVYLVIVNHGHRWAIAVISWRWALVGKMTKVESKREEHLCTRRRASTRKRSRSEV
jgi:hypothetical protein